MKTAKNDTSDGTARRRRKRTGLGRPFLRLWSVTGSSNLADGILLAGLPVLATTITTDAAPVAAVTTVFLFSMGVASLPSGVLADRGNRRQVLIGTNLVRAFTLGVLATLAVFIDIRLVLIYAAAAVSGSTEVVNDVTAETAVPELVSGDDLTRAHGRLTATQIVLNDGVGAPIGAVFGAVGAGWALGVPAVLYLFGAVLAIPLTLPTRVKRQRATKSPTLSDIAEGARALRADPLLRRMAVASGFMNLANTAFFSVAILIVIGPMNLPRSTYGLVLGAVAVGGMIGGATSEPIVRRLGPRRVLRMGPATIGLGYALVCGIPHPSVAVPALLALSAAGMSWNVTSRVLRQQRVPEHLLGRVSVSSRLISLCATPIGGVSAAVVANHWGVQAVGFVTTAAALAALSVIWNAPTDTTTPEDATAQLRDTSASNGATFDDDIDRSA